MGGTLFGRDEPRYRMIVRTWTPPNFAQAAVTLLFHYAPNFFGDRRAFPLPNEDPSHCIIIDTISHVTSH
jgi:hypothetical protein